VEVKGCFGLEVGGKWEDTHYVRVHQSSQKPSELHQRPVSRSTTVINRAFTPMTVQFGDNDWISDLVDSELDV